MAIPIVKKIKIDLSSIKGKGANERKKEAMAEVAEYLEDTVLDRVSKGISPVSGQGAFKGLSKNYRKIKSKKSGSTKANLVSIYSKL